jgi:hypothetical protein
MLQCLASRGSYSSFGQIIFFTSGSCLLRDQPEDAPYNRTCRPTQNIEGHNRNTSSVFRFNIYRYIFKRVITE